MLVLESAIGRSTFAETDVLARNIHGSRIQGGEGIAQVARQ